MTTYRTEHVLAQVDENQNIKSISFQQIETSENGIEVEGIWELYFDPAREEHIDIVMAEIMDDMKVNDVLDAAIVARNLPNFDPRNL